ncbi:peptide cleavage/export ABC transporter [Enterococcus quebecensis]|uniref:Peptide ABC transporter ATP-binding protein n=1 Tax=Enterococcus quebecensis TaxID=903983 RepID=A0A1E5GTD9_9ENTE|nr:peptide cleavage/export ABC transporter [Enterococcus quebecensis]OEG15945.1 peptide ABC transporter ATP-binding protein [Enterococcus quebecensis]OJG74917.1 ABC-type bacteriocin transporter [Enterococcus quebecensis]
MAIKLMKQQDQKDCGVVCLAMILNYYKTEIPINKLRELSGTDIDGTSVFGLKTCLKKLNFDCKAVEAESAIWKEKELPLPLVAHVLIDQSYLHYVVVYKVQGDTLFIADPERGLVKQSIQEFEQQWTGVLLLMTPNETYQPITEKVGNLTSYLPILFKQKKIITYIVLASAFITLFGVLGPYYFQGIIDSFIPRRTVSTLNVISIGLIFVYFFQAFFEYSRNYLLVILGQKMSISVMLSYFKHVLKLPLSFFSTRKSGEIISRFLDANKIIDALASVTLSICLDIAMVVIIGLILFLQNRLLFLISLGTIPFYLLAILAFVKAFDRSNEEEMVAGSALNASIIESIEGIETIKSYNGEDKVYDKVDQQFKQLMKKSFKQSNLDNIQQVIKRCIQLISSVLILWIGSYLVIGGTISLGQLISFNALLVFFTEPLQNIINLQVKMQTAQVASRRLNEIFYIDEEQQKSDSYKIVDPIIFKEGIWIKNVSFSYGMKMPVLQNISVSIKAGSKVALVGISGSGKSTLAKLLVHFHSPSEGDIFYQKTNMKEIDRYFLRDHVTYVPQESFFFHGTIMENLVFGLTDLPSFERIVEVCEMVQLMDYVNQQPLNFDTLIEEGGTNLSGGQKQRIALARALLKDAEILILDEATSGMDTLLEHAIVQNLKQLPNKTILFIAHRLSIAKVCDHIFVMHQGNLIEQGTHKELRFNAGMYQQLWEIDS